MKSDDLHWIAGLLEGEGCFTVNRQSRGDWKKTYLRVQVVMTDLDVLERLHEIVGCGTLRERKMKRGPKHAVTYRWSCSSADAERVMRLVYPLMGERRRSQIDDALSEATT